MLSKQKSVHRTLDGNPNQAPHAANDKFPQDQSQEKRDGFSMGAHAAVFQNDPLNDRTDEDRKPENVHRPTAGYGKASGMKGPPEHTHPHHHQEEGDQHSDKHGGDCRVVGCTRRS